MEFKEQSVPTGILLKIRKLQALAERGVGGEATNAKILLSALCEKYGIDESKLDEEEKQWYEFEMRTLVQKLFQIAYYDKFKMYASETCDEYEAQRSKKKDSDLTMEDILAINMMAAACKNKSFYKQIGEANDDEDDE